MRAATLFEEHASVLPHWAEAGVRGATLVTLDAHLDLQFIDDARIDRLRQAGAAGLRALEAAHPLDPRRDTACFGIEDFLLAATRLGLVRRVIWVAPPHVLQAGVGMALAGLQQMEGVDVEQLASFRRTPRGWVQGCLLGVDLTIGTLEQLATEPVDGPVLVDIDADYFVEVPQDRLWADPGRVVGVLQGWLGPELPLTVARSVGTGFLPLRHRFIADHLAAAWEGRADDARHWQQLVLAERSDAGRARNILLGEAATRPDCAATPHALGWHSTGEEQATWYAGAAALDPAYADDPLRRLGGWRARRQRVDLAALLAVEREVRALPPDDSRTAPCWVALGLLHAAFDRIEEAVTCDGRSRVDGAGHPDLALAIGRLYLARGDGPGARPWFEAAAKDDETRVAAWLQLADLDLAGGLLAEARRHASAAHRAAPAWPLPLQRLAAIAQAAGDAASSVAFQRMRDGLEHRLQLLAQALG